MFITATLYVHVMSFGVRCLDTSSYLGGVKNIGSRVVTTDHPRQVRSLTLSWCAEKSVLALTSTHTVLHVSADDIVG